MSTFSYFGINISKFTKRWNITVWHLFHGRYNVLFALSRDFLDQSDIAFYRKIILRYTYIYGCCQCPHLVLIKYMITRVVFGIIKQYQQFWKQTIVSFFGLFAFYVYLHSLKTRCIVLAMSICFPGIYQKEKFLDICKEMAKSHHSIHNWYKKRR